MQKRAKNQSYFFTIDFLINFECSILFDQLNYDNFFNYSDSVFQRYK